MIGNLRPYPAMKDSGVPSIGEVPEHWEMRRLRNAAEMRVSNVDKHTKVDEQPVRLCNYVDVYKNDRIRSHMMFMRATATADEIERFRLQEGDVLITKDSEVWNDIGVPALVVKAAADLISGYHLALVRSFDHCLEGSYLFRALQCTSVAYQFHVAANGVTRYGLSHSAIKGAWLPLPPLPEQAAIVRFLDHVDRRIRHYIRAKQKLITLLDEQKQAIIHHAVTRGLDADVSLKTSRVEGLGHVPENWNIRPLKHCISEGTSISYGIVQPGDHTPDGVPFVQTGNLTRQDFEPDNLQRTTREIAAKYPRSVVRPGDVLLGIRASVGNAAVAPPTLDGANLSRGIARIAPSSSLDPQYLAFYLQSQATQRFWAAFQQGTTFNEIPIALVRVLPVLLPPIQEQRSIVAFVLTQSRRPNAAIAHTRKEISLLREYRTRLIADVVTGKLDVREPAAHLPDEADTPEPLDEPEMLDVAAEPTADEAEFEEVEA